MIHDPSLTYNMPGYYGNRRPTRGRGRRTGSKASSYRKIATRAPTAGNQKRQIMSLSRRLNTVSRRVADRTYKIMHSQSITLQNLAQPAYVVDLCNVPTWISVFGETTNTDAGGKYTGTKMSLDFQLLAGDETEAVSWTMFIVTPLSEKVCEETQNPNGALSGLTAHTDYNLINGTCILNQKRWKIHYVTRGTTQPLVTNAHSVLPGTTTNYVNDTKPYRKFLSFKPNLKIVNRTGTWDQTTPRDLNHTNRYQMFIFNNNASTIEGSPKWSLNVVHTGIASQ